ncbi:hypothetical protein roselon_01989 [Roseibacterium elongatum DSM 19469]|uniref:TPR domain protein n=1 Tax=Roseicyclus elongatus DSM 19469 TaxID=1294273 RepID=W8S2B5_9RHOB|nr:tetratricopeptide repeat-containing sulfotransferase family protein [Roseibacterium elongatum]AHM04342.1 hypothetical protein roselon_01989 [Roseibacterium elongatum DSM 19469]
MLPPNKSQVPALYQQALKLQQAGQLTEARGIYERVLLVVPGQAEVLFQLGRIEAQLGDAAKSEGYLRKALKAKPTEAAIWQALHGVLEGPARQKLAREALKARVPLGLPAEVQPILKQIAQGQAEVAEKRALALAKAAPLAAAPPHALGVARMARGHWAAAIKPLEAALARDPANSVYKGDLARALARVGQPRRAEALMHEAMAAGHSMARPLARLLRDTCRADAAAKLLVKAAGAQPRDVDLQMELASVLAELRRPDEARRALETAIKAGGARRSLTARLAQDLETAGEGAAARALLDALLAREPAEPGLLTQRAQLRQTCGDLAGAETDLAAALAADPSYAEAYRAYANGRRIEGDDPVLSRMEAQLGRPSLDARARRTLGFAAAKAMHDLRRYDEAADHLARANRLMASAFPYGFEADLAEARLLVSEWRATLQGLTPEGPDDPVLFVTGLPRSGTTLAETILAAHSRVTPAGELPFLYRALAPAIDALRSGSGGATDFAEAGARYLAAARRRSGAADIIADKAISTFSRIGHAAMALPGARFIVLRRDPRDVGLSLWRNLFAEGQHRYAYDLAQMGRYIRLHDALVRFWSEALPERVHVLDYEELTARPESQIRALIAFAGLEWEGACLSPETADRAISTLSFATARQPIGRDAVAGWRHYETALAPLLSALETEVSLFPTD